MGEDVALFIDWENFKISLAVGRRHPNVSALKEEVSNHGRVVVARAYADWVTRAPELRGASQFINDPPALYAAGIDPVYVPTRLATGNGSNGEPGRTIRVKNSVDVKMTADCIECAHSYPNIRTFVLVSGDSDFIHVINALRTMGKRVIIIGVSWATSRRLSDQVDELILYDVDVDTVTPPEPVRAGNGRTEAQPRQATAAAATAPVTPARIELPQIISTIEEIVRDERKAGGTPLLTSIKQRIMRRFPEFDEKKVGFSGFKKLMSRVAEEGQIRLITAGLVDWAIMADEPEPDEAHTGSSRASSPPAARGKGRQSARSQPASDAVATVTEEETPVIEETPADERVLEAVANADEVPELTPVVEEETADESGAETGVDTQEPQPVNEAETIPGYAEAEPAPLPVEQPSIDLDALLVEAMAGLDLPSGPDDGQNGRRIADLIVMADTLEDRGDVSHVAFNFLVTEVCQALDEGLKAEHDEITNRWGTVYSKSFVARMVRGLGNGELFVKGWFNAPAEDGGRARRLRTFYLNREHPLVQGVLQSRWEPLDAAPVSAGETNGVAADDEVLDAAPSDAEDAVLTSFSPADV